jgi:dCMP deaminase
VFPCSDCARAAIQSGIVPVNTFRRPEVDETFDRSFDIATTMFEEAHVELRLFADKNI